VYALLRELFVELGEVMYKQKLISDPRDVYYLDIEELFQILDGSGYDDNLKEIIEKRKTKYEEYKKIKTPTRFATIGAITKLPEGFVINAKERHIMSTVTLEGSIASPGIVEGRVMVLNEPIVPTEPFDILVVNHTDPGWTPLIALSKGLIVEHGGILSHAAIVTRELGIPSIIGVEGATSKLRTGQNVRLDATNGTIVQL
jgi:pyruvate,water dikinase